MKIRLISDLHIDVNRDYGVSLVENGENDVFTLIAGDICGMVDDTIEWLGKNVKKGAFCAGNHLVYDPMVRIFGSKVPIEDMKDKLHKAFPLESDITFMDYDVGVVKKEIGEGLLLVSDVMYTDYRLKIPIVNPNGIVRKNMSMAEPRSFGGSYLNDFVFGFTRKRMYADKDHDGLPKGLWHLRPKYYKDHHAKAWKAVTEAVESNPDKDVILMTHHCLSPRCISKEYVNDSLNASYVSDKEKWIESHPNVKLILSGHVHHRAHFTVGSTLYVLNPLGYCRDTATQVDPETGNEEMWTPDCFVDTKTWKLSYEPYDNEKWRELLEIRGEQLARYSRFFF